MTRRAGALALVVALGGGLAAAGCGLLPGADGCGQPSGFALSLASDTGGQPTPVAAATWFATHGGVGPLPRRGWHVLHRDAEGVRLRAGSSTVHVMQGRDGTWQVDSGTRCR